MPKDKFGILPYRFEKIRDRYLITNELGSWTFLTRDEFLSLSRHDLDKKQNLVDKLKAAGIILDDKNIKNIIRDYRNINRFLFQGPSLHIVVPTLRCNHECIYCHAKPPEEKGLDMNMETAIKAIDFIFKTESPAISIEFHGGEPLLNWDIVKFFVEEAKKLNENFERKDLKISIVTNLSLMTEEKLDFLIDNGVSICTSLDGPENVHNSNRKYIGGGETYKDVVYWIGKIKKIYKERGSNMRLNALPTITRNSLPYWKEIIDEYIKQDLNPVIHLKFLNKLGAARENWDRISYKAEEFIDFWKKSMDYIIELNKRGTYIEERMAKVMLAKILDKMDIGFTELMSPCGAGRTQLLYNYNGDIYTCDEGRMLGEEMFRLGSVNKNSYKEIIRSENLIGTCYASVLGNYCNHCAFKPYCGTCPVMNYVEQGSIVPRITETMRHKIYKEQFLYLFNRMLEDSVKDIFKGWVSEKGDKR